MKPAFKSENFLFRPTCLGDAFARAFGGQAPHLVRESKMEGLLKARHDKDNTLPSIRVPIVPVPESVAA